MILPDNVDKEKIAASVEHGVLKGSGFFDLLPQFGVLLFFAVVFNSWAVISYRKNN